MSTVLENRAAERDQLRQAVLRHVTYSLGSAPERLSPAEAFRAVALAVRDRLVEARLATEQRYRRARAKRLYYLSLEFLIGRSLVNNLINLGLYDAFRDALGGFGVTPADVEESEVDAALGNGGLGRLAACFLDSLATLALPGFGYGINYEYGLFKQEIRNNQQVERPDTWRAYPSPWEIERPQDAVLVPLYGHIEHGVDRHGNYNPMWADWRAVLGVPHDMLIAGYGGKTVIPPAPRTNSTSASSTRATTSKPSRTRFSRRRSPKSSIPARRPPPAASCAWCRSISSSPVPSATSSVPTSATTTTSRSSPTRWPSSSTTPTPL